MLLALTPPLIRPTVGLRLGRAVTERRTLACPNGICVESYVAADIVRRALQVPMVLSLTIVVRILGTL